MTLTIAIPTYNRNTLLRNHLQLLLPQLTPECRVLILDNRSTEPVAETLAPLLAPFPKDQIQVIRNRVNVGANGNILRCFETCETPWLWVLGDDDKVQPDAIAILFQMIAAHPQATYINFHCEHYTRPATFTTLGKSDFIQRIDSFGTCLFVSCCLWRREPLLGQMHWGYQLASSWAPHLAMLLQSLGSQGECVFSNRQIIHYEPAPPEVRWSHLNFAMWAPILADLPMSTADRQSLLHSVVSAFPSISVLLAEILVRYREGQIDRGTAMHLMDQIYFRGQYVRGGFVNRLRNAAARLLTRAPGLGYKLLNRFYRFRTGHSLDTHPSTIGLAIVSKKEP